MVENMGARVTHDRGRGGPLLDGRPFGLAGLCALGVRGQTWGGLWTLLFLPPPTDGHARQGPAAHKAGSQVMAGWQSMEPEQVSGPGVPKDDSNQKRNEALGAQPQPRREVVSTGLQRLGSGEVTRVTGAVLQHPHPHIHVILTSAPGCKVPCQSTQFWSFIGAEFVLWLSDVEVTSFSCFVHETSYA